jgi:PAS domain S-box-containing protein
MSPTYVPSPTPRHRGRLIILLSVAALAMTALIGYLVWSGYRDVIRTAETTSRNYAAIVEAPLDATLRRAAADLQELAREDVLAGWRTRALAVGAAGLLLLLLLGNLLSRLWRAQAWLDASEELMRSTFEQAAMGIAHISPDNYCILRSNDGFCELLGYTQYELIGTDSRARTPADEMPARAAETALLVAGKIKTSSRERRLLRKDGSSVWVNDSLSLVRDPAGQPKYFISVIEDLSERRRAEEALRLSEANLRAVAENSCVGVTVFQDGRRVFANRHAADMLGYSVEEFLPLAVSDIVHPDSQDLAWERSRRRAAGEYLPARYEFTALTKDGRAIPVEGNYAVIVWDGRPAFLVFAADITERKLTEDTLQLLSMGIAHLKGEAFFNQVSAQTSRLLGLEIGFVARLLGPDSSRIRMIGWCIDGEFPRPIEFGLAGTPCEAAVGRKVAIFVDQVQQLFPSARMLVDWNVASYAAVPLFDSNGRVIGTVGVMGRAPLRQPQQVESLLRLFAVRAAAEMERTEVERRFHDLFEYSPDANVIVNQAGLVTAMNRQAETLFGYSREERVGLEVEELIPQADKPGHEKSRRGYFLNPVSRAMGTALAGLHAQRKDGTVFPADISLNPLHSDEGMLVVATVRDITARLEVERQQQRLETQLRQSQKMEAIGTLAGGIAHDFNNVITAIIGNVELARVDVGADHPAMASLDEIGKASRRARDLVSQILAFSRQQPHARRAISLTPLVEEVVKLLRATLPAGIELGTTLAAEVPSVLADPAQIHQILINLCTNAWHAMDDGRGRIDIQVNTAVLGENAVRLHADLQPGRYAHLSVKDTGKGVDAVTLERIFEPFFTTKAVGEGTGLGLSVIHGIMRSYRGAVTVHSEPGAGTIFDLYFPATELAPAAPLRGRGQHVLYLDDDESLVLLITRMLERSGYRVTGYTEPAHALQALRADPGQFDLVLTDYSMPGMSGLDVAREVSRIRPDLPVAVTSGFITDELRDKAPAAGARHLIYKPNSVDELGETVQRLLDQEN